LASSNLNCSSYAGSCTSMANSIKSNLNMCSTLPVLGSACAAGSGCSVSVSASPTAINNATNLYQQYSGSGYVQCVAGTCKSASCSGSNGVRACYKCNVLGNASTGAQYEQEVASCTAYKSVACVCEIAHQSVYCQM
jgi:hypothetical protein